MDREDKAQEIPFEQVLDNLLGDEAIKVPLLFRLSDLETADFTQFKTRWLLVDDERREAVARHLADISEENYVVDFAPIFAFLLKDLLASVRQAALDGLWDATDLSLLQPIMKLMTEDEETAVRASAAATLAHYVLLSEWGQLPAHVSGKIVPQLLAQYEAPDAPLAVRRAALEAMAAANHPRIHELIIEAYHDADPYLQMSAVFAMGSSADPRWLPTVLQEMESHMPEMRAEAARAAGNIGSSDAIADLADLAIDEDEDVALAAISALGQIGGDEATRILQELFDDPEFEPFQEAIEEALEEMSWLSGALNMLSFAEDEDEGDDEMGMFSLN